MGGKHKVANRTKNNARPSSSGRSAAMLNSAVPQFSGFSGMKDSTGFSTFTLGAVDEFDSSIDGNFQLVLKKISKKDSTTKLKGLQEFADLVKNADPDVVKAVLPIWPRFYNVLATDTDNRVREATHNVHHEIVLKVKRNIAPFLKQLIAPWFTSQYDNYPPAATAAVQAFKDTFSANKFQEAIIFCQEEVLAYINENLLVQTAQTICGKQASPEDAEAKYERVLISCLQGYALYLKKVPANKIEEASQANSQIVNNHKFWKLAKHTIPLVRSAWFKVLGAICQKAMFLLKDKEAQALTTIFNNLEDGEPTVLPHIWECVLLTISLIAEWWKYVNVEKLFIPKLMKVLKQAGQGNAAVIYPNLLPLISHLPPMIAENATQFYSNLFENIRAGFKLKCILSSKSESAAVATAFIECLQYVLIKSSSDVHLCKTLIKDQLLSTIEWCLTDDNSCYKIIFNQTAPFVQYLSRSSQSESTQVLLTFFFDNLQDLFSIVLYEQQNGQGNIMSISEKQIDFLQSLKQTHRSKRHSKVKFASEDGKTVTIHKKEKTCGTESNEMYLKTLNQVVVNICLKYVNFIEEYQCKDLLEKLCSLIMDFDRKEIFVSLTKQMKIKDSNVQIMDIYYNLLRKWLKSDKLYSKSVIDLIFLLFIYLADNEKDIVLKDLEQISKPNSLQWSISEALSYPNIEDPIIQKWLKDEHIGKFFVSVSEKQINNDCSSELSALFKLALTENMNGELFIAKEILSEIIEKLSSTLLGQIDTITSLDSCSSIASYLCTIIYTDNLLLTYGEKLLLTLFELSCKIRNENEVMSSETIWEVNSAWQDAVTILLSVLSKEQTQSLTESFANIVEKQFFACDSTNNDHIDHLTNVVVNFLRASYKSAPLSISPLVDILFNRGWTSRNETVTDLCRVAEYIRGNLGCPHNEILIENNLNEIEILQYFAWSFIKFNVFGSEIIINEETDEDEHEENLDIVRKKVTVLTVIDKHVDRSLDALYEYTVGESFLLYFNNVKYYNEVLYYNTLLEEKLQEALNNFEEFTLSETKTKLKKRCLSKGWFWCKATYNLYSKLLRNEELSKIYNDLTETIVEQSLIGVLHVKQVFKNDRSDRQLEIDDINKQFADMFEKMENLRNENISEFLYDNAGNISWAKAEKVIEVVRMSSNLIKSAKLTKRYWDFSVLSLVSWASNCLKAKTMYRSFQYQAMLVSVAELYINTCEYVKKLQQEQVDMNYVNEWEDVLVESVHADLSQIWLYLAEQLPTRSENPLFNIPLIQYFGRVTEYIRYEFIFKVNDNFPKWTKFLKRGCILITSPIIVLQLWGYRMLLALIPGLIKIDTEAVNTNTPHKKGLIFEQFKEKHMEVQDVVNSVLIEFRMGEETCRVEPSFDSFTYTFAYLLLWDVLLSLCEQSSTELRYQYADWLKNSELLKYFLPNLLRLMPIEVLHYSEGKSTSMSENFLQKSINESCYTKSCDSDTIEQIVCYLYKSSLANLPALIRQWWTDLDTRANQVVDKITTLYVSPYLCMEELNNVMQHQNKFKNMTIKVMPSIREILAVYTVDEAQMELTITLPANYPLGSPDVHCNRQISGTTHKQWLLQFKKCVLHQNGRIWDGLSLWNSNLDKKFDGVEECYICFAVLHFGTYQLPRLSCQTCKKKFHSACLYKWFSTSNKSSCPICRNLF